jgi:hypothetical protein
LGCGGHGTYKEYDSSGYCSDFVRTEGRLAFGDARHAFDHSDNALTDNDECEKLKPLDKMCVFEADYPPDNGDEKHCKALGDGDSNPL